MVDALGTSGSGRELLLGLLLTLLGAVRMRMRDRTDIARGCTSGLFYGRGRNPTLSGCPPTARVSGS